MTTRLRQIALALFVGWLAGGDPAASLPADAQPLLAIGPGRGCEHREGRVDQPPGATATAILIRSGESAARELREQQRTRLRDLGQVLASMADAALPELTDAAIGRLRVTVYPAPLCPHPRASRGPPASAARAI